MDTEQQCTHKLRCIGLLVYYENRGDLDVSNGGPGLKAFPPGFRMISGSAASRSDQ